MSQGLLRVLSDVSQQGNARNMEEYYGDDFRDRAVVAFEDSVVVNRFADRVHQAAFRVRRNQERWRLAGCISGLVLSRWERTRC